MSGEKHRDRFQMTDYIFGKPKARVFQVYPRQDSALQSSTLCSFFLVNPQGSTHPTSIPQ